MGILIVYSRILLIRLINSLTASRRAPSYTAPQIGGVPLTRPLPKAVLIAAHRQQRGDDLVGWNHGADRRVGVVAEGMKAKCRNHRRSLAGPMATDR